MMCLSSASARNVFSAALNVKLFKVEGLLTGISIQCFYHSLAGKNHCESDSCVSFLCAVIVEGLVHPKMILSFTHTQDILVVHDFLLSDESNRSYTKICSGSSKLYHCSQRGVSVTQSKTCKIKCTKP